ncbi:hypothetical protein ACFORJ_01675 [Corynebacterium hansenii]|uniref:Uncharacterized protein n=1 Tax=Corynebacterium hansenii TaxID=394964 RepID=A0ABV7ZM70_9CORY|nr:hypothetical protein [Corynebacterium hansenii]WJY99291.1 hypothetical protein CHAN_03315 [Corynebacterium hansenii]
MATRKPATRKPTAPPHVSIDRGDGTTAITPVDVADTPVLVGLLLDAAGSASDVATTTGPHGWVVPTAVAKKAGLAP